MKRTLAQKILDTRESFEMAERLAIALPLVVVMVLQIGLAGKVLTDAEATELTNLGGFGVDPWTIALWFVAFYVGMAWLRWIAGFALALDDKYGSDTA